MCEIRAFEFDDLPLTEPLNYAELPHYVPVIYSNAANRRERLDAPFITVPLIQLINLDNGELRFQKREELADHFGFSADAKIIFSGVMEDVPLERYWYVRNRELILALKKLEPILVTSPNFSSFCNAPRWDNMFNLKRIAICWNEFVAAGIPTALHMNARTPHDWQRWTKFIKERPDIRSISFEFATIKGSRKPWYVRRLLELAKNVDRELQLVIRGGKRYISRLGKIYENVTFLDTDAFMKATMRQVIPLEGAPVSVASEFIDNHLRQNVLTRSEILKYELAGPTT